MGPPHPKLQQLWQGNCWVAKGEPCPCKQLGPIEGEKDDDGASTQVPGMRVAVGNGVCQGAKAGKKRKQTTVS